MKKKVSEYNVVKHRNALKRWGQRLDREGKVPRRDTSNVFRYIWGNEIVAPVELSVYSPEEDSFKETLSFIDYIKNKYDPRKDTIDFSKTEGTTAAALILLYSVLEQSIDDYDGEARFVKSLNAKVNAHLKRSNIIKLLKNSEIFYSLEKAEFIPIVSSVDSDYTDEVAKHIKHNYFKDEWSEEESAEREWVLGSAIHETVDNVRTHAYPKYDNDDKKWWLSCDVIEDEIFLAIYDLGVGIPKTVHEQEWFESVLRNTRPAVYEVIKKIKNKKPFIDKVRNKLSDAELIAISMLDDYSGTGKQKHGQGSKSIKNLVHDTDNGMLWVYSGRGLYKFCNEVSKPTLSSLPRAIPGTLIQWNIKLP